jgi:hypothetical protein
MGFLAATGSRSYGEPRNLSVAVIAPTLATSSEARAILARQGWHESSLKRADAILVVVRSNLYDPLEFSYQSTVDLRKDADSQPNISGESVHIYLYSVDDRLGVSQLKHNSHKVDQP